MDVMLMEGKGEEKASLRDEGEDEDEEEAAAEEALEVRRRGGQERVSRAHRHGKVTTG